MKSLFTFLLCLPALFNFAQAPSKPVNIILTGKVNSYQAEEKPYILCYGRRQVHHPQPHQNGCIAGVYVRSVEDQV